jgi:hypothetical protein
VAASAIVALSCGPASANSICFGTPAQGRLEGACQLPSSGPNFAPYTLEGVRQGRTFVQRVATREVDLARLDDVTNLHICRGYHSVQWRSHLGVPQIDFQCHDFEPGRVLGRAHEGTDAISRRLTLRG